MNTRPPGRRSRAGARAALLLGLLVAACGPGCASEPAAGDGGNRADAGPEDGASVPDVTPGDARDASSDAGDAGLEDLGPFPEGFLFGTASAAFQAEGGNHESDWWQWTQMEGRVAGGASPDDGPDYYTRFAEDHARAREAGHNAVRLSLEWGRLYPTREAFDKDTPDPAALDFYDRLIDDLRSRGLEPMVTLQHLTTPVWLHDLADRKNRPGWVSPEIVPVFAEFAGRMAARYGDRVDLWLTINEPQTLALVGYVAGVFPPGDQLNFDGARLATLNMIRGHAAAYDAIKANDTVDADGDGQASLVSFATHNRVFLPADEDHPDHVRAADRTRYIGNRLFLDAVTRGDLDADFDESLDGPEDVRDDPTLRGRLDYIGLNYYGLSLVTYLSDGIPILGIPALVDLDTDNPKNDLGWDIYPQGLATVLDELQPYGLPIHITENGVADAADNKRARFVAEHLVEVLRAIRRGVDVRGYFYWSLTDNFEWAEGYCPRFGMWRVDYASPERTRTPSAAVETLRQIIEANTVTPALLRALPPYGAPDRCGAKP